MSRNSLFDFWADVPADARIHPQDVPVFTKLRHANGPGHELDLRCLPSNVLGPVRTARVVLLFQNPGVDPQDIAEADRPEAQARYGRQRQGREPLPRQEDHAGAWTWWRDSTRLYGNWQDLRERIAILNICPYHSVRFKRTGLFVALPSARAAVAWAQDVLFPQAVAGERVVVVMRSAREWGVGCGLHGRSLFVPSFNRRGIPNHGVDTPTSRKIIVAAVREALAQPPFDSD